MLKLMATVALAALAVSVRAEVVAITATRMIDVTDGHSIANPVVLVDNGRITAVGAAGSTPDNPDRTSSNAPGSGMITVIASPPPR